MLLSQGNSQGWYLCVIILIPSSSNAFLVPLPEPQRQDGHMQRFIREVNTTSRACVLWDLEEETDYIIQVQSIGLYGESQASKKVHFRTLKKSDRFPSNSSNQGRPLLVSPLCYQIQCNNEANTSFFIV